MSILGREPVTISPPLLTGARLVVAVELTQDLTLILSTKNNKQSKTKRKANKNSSTAKKVEVDSL